MKKSLFILLSVIIFTPAFSKVNIIVSIQPQMEFVKKIGGDKIKVTLMVLPGKSPHTYEPKPQQMIEVSKADIYLSIGVEFEKVWLPKFKSQNRNLRIIDISKDINRTAMQSKDKKNRHAHRHEALDPHIWVDPLNVKQIAKNIFTALSSIDSNNSDYYQKNLHNYIKELDTLDREIREILKESHKNTKFMVFHPSWGYFAKRYNLEQLTIEVEGKTPKPREIVQILKEAKKEKIKVIFTQPEFSDKTSKTIANELKIEVVKTSPLAKNWADNLKNLAKNIAESN
ncbi:MAG: zinc ABC transporter substrate-binding protein [Sulfurovum sp.]|nr:MAG: zinc ABC transporter substrate-binding protein [Sulfurovum sp.]